MACAKSRVYSCYIQQKSGKNSRQTENEPGHIKTKKTPVKAPPNDPVPWCATLTAAGRYNHPPAKGRRTGKYFAGNSAFQSAPAVSE